MQANRRNIFIATMLAGLLGSAIPAAAHTPHHGSPAMQSKYVQADAALRDLWVGHVFWVRSVAVAALSANPGAAKAAEQEAVANAKQIAAAMEPFYGKAASDKLFTLLGGHYGAVKQYLDATIAASPQQQDAARAAMGENAMQIAQFLSSANPHLPIDGVRAMLLAHGAHHIHQIVQLRDKQYAQEARTWDEMKSHMYALADTLTDALAKQFPRKFD